MKLLLHTCCAPCSVKSAEAFAAEGWQITLFWYNPNIRPHEEYNSRRDSLIRLAEEKKHPLIINEYTKEDLTQRCKDAVEKCFCCYRLRLEKTAGIAAENGFDAYSTTLLISPYQKHEMIKEIGEGASEELGIRNEKGVVKGGAEKSPVFLYRDLRPLFRESKKLAREAGYYIQKYCGCGL